jgi:citrate synthase
MSVEAALPRDPIPRIRDAANIAKAMSSSWRRASAAGALPRQLRARQLPGASQLYYRGKNAAVLSASETLESVAQLLWDCPDPLSVSAGNSGPTVMSEVYAQIAALAAAQMPTPGRSRAILLGEAGQVLSTMANAFTGARVGLLHARLAATWHRPDAAEVIRRALVLLAEHELNASTFAARIAASTGAPLAAAVMAGLATLSGPLHGSAAMSLLPLVAEARRIGVEPAVAAALRSGHHLPAFGHNLYDGDVRARALMDAFDVPKLYREIAETGEGLSGEKPNIDFALSAITAAFDLPADAPLQLFALARSVGWLAHALEQIEKGSLIRPRARYVGEAPTSH